MAPAGPPAASTGATPRKRLVRRFLLSALAVAILLALIVVIAIVAVREHRPQRTESDPPPPEPAGIIDPASPTAPVPTAAGLAKALDSYAQHMDSAPGAFSGEVRDAETGDVLWSHDAGEALTPASVTKVLTAVAALHVLDPQDRAVTALVETSPGTAVLVSSGDPTLSQSGAGFYTDAASLAELAEKARGRGITTLHVATSPYSGSTLAPHVHEDDVSGGFIAPMEPVMVDGGRLSEGDEVPRTTEPAASAAKTLATMLGASYGGEYSGSPDSLPQLVEAPASAEEIARVESAPLTTRLRDMLVHSDNVLAEAIGREVAAASGQPQSFEGASTAVRDALRDTGSDVSSTKLADTSGMSGANRISATTLGEALWSTNLTDVLAIAGGSGTLADRFVSSDAAGWVRAKTGTLTTVTSLAGTVTTQDGRALVFAFLSNGPGSIERRPLVDGMASALHECGCR